MYQKGLGARLRAMHPSTATHIQVHMSTQGRTIVTKRLAIIALELRVEIVVVIVRHQKACITYHIETSV